MKKRKAKRKPPKEKIVFQDKIVYRDVPPGVPLIVIQQQLDALLDQIKSMHSMVNHAMLLVRDQIVVRPGLLGEKYRK